MMTTYHINDIEEIAKQILSLYPDTRCFAFYAEMGSGKTTLINAICRALGVTEATSSPTFSIINEYRGTANKRIYHMDWYRLKGAQDAVEAGVQEVLEEKDTCSFIEWPEIADSLLPTFTVKVKISIESEDTRRLEI